jgi:HEAT repeat protein
MGEIEELEPGLQADIENQLLLVANSSAPEPVRRNALESLGFASRGEVTILIEQAYISTDEDWVASALVAMGRSANMKWAPQVMNMLDSDAAQIREQAARAAGELELGAARPRLLELLDDDDEDVIAASIWSLSQIGGEGVSAALEALYDEAEDDDTASYIEAALDNLAFNQELQLLDLVEPGEDDEYYDDLIADDEEEDDDEDEADDQEDPSGKGAKRRA